MPKISVIVPTYNVREYLGECLESLARQTYEDIEIITVDDLSEDKCWEISDEYSNKDTRFITVRHEKNTRQGGARNTGLKLARGEYIAFVDGDDVVDNGMMKQLLATLEAASADIVECGMARFSDDPNSKKPFFCHKENVSIPADTALRSLLDNGIYSIYPGPCNKLFSRKALKGVLFPEGLFFEDLPFIVEAIAKSNTYAFLNKDLYCYRIREGSATSSISEDHISAMQQSLRLTKEALQRNGKYDENKESYFSLYYRVAVKYLIDTVIGRNIKEKNEKDRYARLAFKEILKTAEIDEFLPYLSYEDIRRTLTAFDNEWANFPRLSVKEKFGFTVNRIVNRVFRNS